MKQRQPRAGLARRFGKGLVLRLDQAMGSTPEPISPASDPHHFAVRLTLPAAEETETEVPNAPSVSEQDPLPATILVVEDELLILGMLSESLRERGYEVIEFSSADEAYRAVQDGLTFDLLLFDVAMRGEMNGEDLAAKVKAADPDKPVIMMSGYGGDQEKGAVSVADYILPKPCETNILTRTLSQALTDANVKRQSKSASDV